VKIEVLSKDEKHTLFRVGEEEIVVENTNLERLEAIRKEREMAAKEREFEQKRKEKLKLETQGELQKLQEKLAAKNEMKNKKSKKR
jgi:hypothetical protein